MPRPPVPSIGSVESEGALLNSDAAPTERKLEVRESIVESLVGSDLDRQMFEAYLADGALDVPRRMSIYVSEKDKALGDGSCI